MQRSNAIVKKLSTTDREQKRRAQNALLANIGISAINEIITAVENESNKVSGSLKKSLENDINELKNALDKLSKKDGLKWNDYFINLKTIIDAMRAKSFQYQKISELKELHSYVKYKLDSIDPIYHLPTIDVSHDLSFLNKVSLLSVCETKRDS